MAADNDNFFGENPFRNLDPHAFPSGKKPAANPDSHCKYVRRTGQSEISLEEKALFLAAMENLPRTDAGRGRKSGFLLSEQCELPDFGKKMKKGKKKPHKAEMKKVESLPDPSGREEENEAFLWAMRDAAPLAAGGRRITKQPRIAPPQIIREPGMEEFMSGELEFALSHTNEYMTCHVVGLDDLTVNQLARGQYSPEAHVDLHGLNAAQAFETLRDFIRSCWFKGLRVALIITGRGLNSPNGHAVLRQKLQSWLTQEPFKRVVLAFCTAQPHDGGAGAIYVLFRKYRKKGKIFWEKMPADADLY